MLPNLRFKISWVPENLVTWDYFCKQLRKEIRSNNSTFDLYTQNVLTYLGALHSHFQPNRTFKMLRNSGSAQYKYSSEGVLYSRVGRYWNWNISIILYSLTIHNILGWFNVVSKVLLEVFLPKKHQFITHHFLQKTLLKQVNIFVILSEL